MIFRDTSSQNGVVIADDVIASIAANAAKDVEGFGSFTTRAPDMVSQVLSVSDKSAFKSIKVRSVDNDVRIQMYINVKSGTNVQAVSAAIQRTVKNSVQSMTGKVVSKVNVCIQGIDFCEPAELKTNS